MKYLCTYCSVYVYDEKSGDPITDLKPGTPWDKIPDTWHCPVCGMPKTYLHQIGDDVFSLKNRAYKNKDVGDKDLSYYRDIAREMLTGTCGVYPVCDGKPGRMCVGQKYGAPIGIGGAGQGKTFEANYDALQNYKLKMRLIKAHKEPKMSVSIFGKDIVAPVMGGGISGVKTSLNNAIPEEALYRALLRGALTSRTIGLVGNTPKSPDDLGVNIVGEHNGWGIPIFKPQAQDRLIELFQLAEKLDVIAVGVDLEGAGSTIWGVSNKGVYRKSEIELQELVDCIEKPVFFKGIMGIEDAAKVVDSGAAACYVSNHGGRVMDGGQGVGEVLPDIAREISGKIPILADGAVRTGFDVVKVLALGADIALVGRTLAQIALGGGAKAVRMYYNYIFEDIRRAMILTGCDTLDEINMDILSH